MTDPHQYIDAEWKKLLRELGYDPLEPSFRQISLSADMHLVRAQWLLLFQDEKIKGLQARLDESERRRKGAEVQIPNLQRRLAVAENVTIEWMLKKIIEKQIWDTLSSLADEHEARQ